MHEFIEVEYTGRVKETNQIFDTTDSKLAKDEGIFNEHMVYGPVIVCLGEGHLVAGLEDELEGKEIGKEYTIDLLPEKAFGKKNINLLKLIPIGKFKKQKIQPYPGLQINIDGEVGVIRTATGGRVIVDFNHPLASKEVIYKVKILRKIEDNADKIKALFKLELHLTDINVEIKEKKVIIETKHNLPEQITTHMTERIKNLIQGLEDIEYRQQKEAEALKP